MFKFDLRDYRLKMSKDWRNMSRRRALVFLVNSVVGLAGAAIIGCDGDEDQKSIPISSAIPTSQPSDNGDSQSNQQPISLELIVDDYIDEAKAEQILANHRLRYDTEHPFGIETREMLTQLPERYMGPIIVNEFVFSLPISGTSNLIFDIRINPIAEINQLLSSGISSDRYILFSRILTALGDPSICPINIDEILLRDYNARGGVAVVPVSNKEDSTQSLDVQIVAFIYKNDLGLQELTEGINGNYHSIENPDGSEFRFIGFGKDEAEKAAGEIPEFRHNLWCSSDEDFPESLMDVSFLWNVQNDIATSYNDLQQINYSDLRKSTIENFRENLIKKYENFASGYMSSEEQESAIDSILRAYRLAANVVDDPYSIQGTVTMHKQVAEWIQKYGENNSDEPKYSNLERGLDAEEERIGGIQPEDFIEDWIDRRRSQALEIGKKLLIEEVYSPILEAADINPNEMNLDTIQVSPHGEGQVKLQLSYKD